MKTPLFRRTEPDERPVNREDRWSRLERFRLRVRRAGLSLRGTARPHARGEQGLDFFDHRPYSPGDELRRIDWQLFARMRKPFVRRFEPPAAARVDVWLDVTGSMALGAPSKIGFAREAAAALAYVALAGADAVALHRFGAEFAAASLRRGTRAFPQLLAQLDAINAAGRGPAPDDVLSPTVSAFLERSRGPGLVVLISDFHWGARWWAAPQSSPDHVPLFGFLERLGRGRELACLAITAPEELDPPHGPREIVDAESGTRRVVNLDGAARERYLTRFTQRRAALVDLCRRRGWLYAHARSDERFETALLPLLSRRPAATLA